MRIGIIISLIIALTLGTAAWLWLDNRPPDKLEIAGIYIPEGKPLADFALTEAGNTPFSLDNFKGKWSFLYFGYTYCPDACPMALGQLKATDKLLDEKGISQDNAYLLISVDPRRDTPERLAEYTQFFNPKFSGATGAAEELDKLAKPLGVYYEVPEDPEDPENYLVNHSSAIVLINPAAQLQAMFTVPHEPAKIAEDFAAIRQRYEAAN